MYIPTIIMSLNRGSFFLGRWTSFLHHRNSYYSSLNPINSCPHRQPNSFPSSFFQAYRDIHLLLHSTHTNNEPQQFSNNINESIDDDNSSLDNASLNVISPSYLSPPTLLGSLFSSFEHRNFSSDNPKSISRLVSAVPKFIKQLNEANIPITPRFCASLMTLYAKAGNMSKVLEYYHHPSKAGILGNVEMNNALLLAYSIAGDNENLYKLYNRMSTREAKRQWWNKKILQERKPTEKEDETPIQSNNQANIQNFQNKFNNFPYTNNLTHKIILKFYFKNHRYLAAANLYKRRIKISTADENAILTSTFIKLIATADLTNSSTPPSTSTILLQFIETIGQLTIWRLSLTDYLHLLSFTISQQSINLSRTLFQQLIKHQSFRLTGILGSPNNNLKYIYNGLFSLFYSNKSYDDCTVVYEDGHRRNFDFSSRLHLCMYCLYLKRNMLDNAEMLRSKIIERMKLTGIYKIIHHRNSSLANSLPITPPPASFYPLHLLHLHQESNINFRESNKLLTEKTLSSSNFFFLPQSESAIALDVRAYLDFLRLETIKAGGSNETIWLILNGSDATNNNIVQIIDQAIRNKETGKVNTVEPSPALSSSLLSLNHFVTRLQKILTPHYSALVEVPSSQFIPVSPSPALLSIRVSSGDPFFNTSTSTQQESREKRISFREISQLLAAFWLQLPSQTLELESSATWVGVGREEWKEEGRKRFGYLQENGEGNAKESLDDRRWSSVQNDLFVAQMVTLFFLLYFTSFRAATEGISPERQSKSRRTV